MTNISGEYNRGYRQALLDAIEFFEATKSVLNVNRRHLTDSRSMMWNNETDKPEFVVEDET